jgi:magnesium transporter
MPRKLRHLLKRELRRSTEVETQSYEEEFYHQPGTLPGTIIVDPDASPLKIVLIDYNNSKVTHKELITPEECTAYLDTESVSWVDVQGLGNVKVLQQLGKVFDLHPLILEDMVNVPERPKIEDYEDQLVIIARMVVPRENLSGFHSEQVSFVLGKHYLLTVQEEPELDCFGTVRMRIKKGKGIIRKQGADYLAYALLDAIIDGFFPVLESYGERIEQLEEEVLLNPTEHTIQKIYRIRRELLQLRRAIWPQRDAVNSLIRDGNQLVNQEVQFYLRDCYDHAVQVMDIVEHYREITSGLMDVYLSVVNNRMNEIVKFLTVISSIFIPLTFIAGIYGMNFNTEVSPWNMPELSFYWGYPLCLAAMAVIATGMVFFFWRKGWFRNLSKIHRE